MVLENDRSHINFGLFGCYEIMTEVIKQKPVFKICYTIL
jgi:hypothetical protein